MSELVLTGLDGFNPLAFFAGLGVLGVLSERAELGGGGGARLFWRDEGVWRAVLVGPGVEGGKAALIEAVMEDLETWRDEPARQLRYVKEKGQPGKTKKKAAKKVKKPEKEGSDAWDIKPPLRIFRDYLLSLVKGAGPRSRRSVDVAAAFATDVVVDGSGNTKPTALHFTVGQQEFLKMVDELIQGVTADDIEEALFGPWQYSRVLPVLRWDVTASRDYALRASDPSKEKTTGVPGADWLAFHGLPFLRVAPIGTQIHTTGCSGGWKTGGRFRWPLWNVPLGRDMVHTVLQLPGLAEMQESERRARGIAVVLESAIRRTDQGGYGSFSPASVI